MGLDLGRVLLHEKVKGEGGLKLFHHGLLDQPAWPHQHKKIPAQDDENEEGEASPEREVPSLEVPEEL